MTQDLSSAKSSYSCKRRRDYITILGIGLFIFVVVFELYLVLWVPLELKSGRVLEKEVARQSMISLGDYIRRTLGEIGVNSKLQRGEVFLARATIDNLAYYVRENQEILSRDQIRVLNELFKDYNVLAEGWKKGKFLIKEERLDCSGYIAGIKEKAGIETKKAPGGK